MDNEQIKINQLSRKYGTVFTVHGFKWIKGSYSNLTTIVKSFGAIYNVVRSLALIPVVQRDLNYFTTTKENWEKCLDTIYGIVKHFKWQKEKFDCDDRAKLVSALCSLLFGLNTCGELYCEVTSLKTGNKIRHYTNLAITSKGEVMLFDVDNGGEKKIIDVGEPISMGKWSYRLISARF